jgi:hypothetical protein
MKIGGRRWEFEVEVQTNVVGYNPEKTVGL